MSRIFVTTILIACVVTLMTAAALALLDAPGGLKVGALVGFLVGLIFLLPRVQARCCPRCGGDLANFSGDACPYCGLSAERFDIRLVHPDDDDAENCCVICGADVPTDDALTGCPVCEAALQQLEGDQVGDAD